MNPTTFFQRQHGPRVRPHAHARLPAPFGLPSCDSGPPSCQNWPRAVRTSSHRFRQAQPAPTAALASASSFGEEQPLTSVARRGVEQLQRKLSSPHDREIMAVALPALVGQLMEPVVSAINAGMVGHLGTQQLGAVSLAGIALNSCTFVFSFLLFLTVPETAAAVAKNDPDEISRVTATSLWVALLTGLLVGAAIFLNSSNIISALRPPEPLAAQFATQYIQIRALSVPAVLLGFVATGVFRGFKDTRTPLFGTAASVTVSLGLHLLLLNVLHLGVVGAAVATALASCCSCAVMMGALVAGGKAQWRHLARPPPLQAMLPLLQRGAVLGTRSVISFGMVLLASTISVRQGSAFQASFEVIRQMWMLSMPFFECINVATQSLCASALGHEDRVTARSLLHRLLVLGVGIGCLAGGGVWLAHEQLVAFFTRDQAVVANVMSSLWLICLCFPLDAAGSILDGSLLAAKQSNYLSAVQIAGATVQYMGLFWIVSTGNVAPLYIWFTIKIMSLARVLGGVFRNFMSPKSAYRIPHKPAAAAAPPAPAPATVTAAAPTAATATPSTATAASPVSASAVSPANGVAHHSLVTAAAAADPVVSPSHSHAAALPLPGGGTTLAAAATPATAAAGAAVAVSAAPA